MSFRYKNGSVNLQNYLSIFQGASPDILDEIRSAILDDTEIEQFIQPCINDSYKLGQIRMAIREMIPQEFLSVKFTGKTLYYIRQGLSHDIDMKPILKYKSSMLDTTDIEKLTEFLYLGVDIDIIDFEDVEKDKIDLVCKGLYKGYPMQLIAYMRGRSIDYFKALMRGMQLGIDVHIFTSEEWDINTLYVLFSYSKKIDLNKFLSLVTYKFSKEEIEVLIKAYSNNVDIKSVCVKDDEGNAVYDCYQMDILLQGIEQNKINHDMFNAKLSAIEMQKIMEKIC